MEQLLYMFGNALVITGVTLFVGSVIILALKNK